MIIISLYSISIIHMTNSTLKRGQTQKFFLAWESYLHTFKREDFISALEFSFGSNPCHCLCVGIKWHSHMLIWRLVRGPLSASSFLPSYQYRQYCPTKAASTPSSTWSLPLRPWGPVSFSAPKKASLNQAASRPSRFPLVLSFWGTSKKSSWSMSMGHLSLWNWPLGKIHL